MLKKFAALALAIAISDILFNSSAVASDTGGLVSGIYALRTVADSRLDTRQVYLSVNQGRISGYFDNPFTQPASNVPGLDPSCRFFLRGVSRDANHFVLHSFYPDKDDGGKVETGGAITLRRVDSGWTLSVDGEFPNCDVATVSSGDRLTLNVAKPAWIRFGYVDVNKAPLYKGSAFSTKTSGYLIRYDPVALLEPETQSEWAHIDYLKVRLGDLVRWVRANDVKFDDPATTGR